LYTEGGATLAFSRAYTLVPGTNTLKIEMSYLNVGPTITIRQFDTFDPDQGAGQGMSSATRNDVFNLGGDQVAQARLDGASSHAVVLGSSATPYTIAAGNPFQIDTGTELNSFFTTPVDGDDTEADSGMHIGFERTLAPGQSASYSIFMAFGLDESSAQASYLNAVPEPSSLVFSACAALGLVTRRRRA
jgi:hypothetical protein